MRYFTRDNQINVYARDTCMISYIWDKDEDTSVYTEQHVRIHGVDIHIRHSTHISFCVLWRLSSVYL